MASAKVLEAKKAEVAALSERFQNACAGVLVDYKGINVADDTALRAELRKEGIEYTVITVYSIPSLRSSARRAVSSATLIPL